ncbi:Pentatricopeptide repeat-containing protein [Vitis vinifera]|uniref:Pentatricopeptide repeat-containing protein n=1 Tax=Vitis vinifera TaxID=29760 RepID=A0A438D1L7_VITVI|nr:Pentatricopeptide repeat-containing protein [Vitis vinifera]
MAAQTKLSSPSLKIADQCLNSSKFRLSSSPLASPNITLLPQGSYLSLQFPVGAISITRIAFFCKFPAQQSPTGQHHKGFLQRQKPKSICLSICQNAAVWGLPRPPNIPLYCKGSRASVRAPARTGGALPHCERGLWFDRFIANSLIHMYGSCGDIGSARKVFDEMLIRNSVSWNAMLDGYAKCGDLDSARQVFESMPDRDVVSWSSMIDGCVKGGEYGVALAIFERMRVVGPKANEVTMVSVLCACAHLGALEQGRTMHQYMVDNTMRFTLVLRTSLMDMYAKCGAIEEAIAVFRGVPMDQTDVLMWNTIIGGLATHGLVHESLELFKEMQVLGIVPDEITYLCLFSACAHGGLVHEAWHFFKSLGKQGMVPKSEHYACMVDVLSRAGQLAEAYDFIAQMPMEPTASMLGALLNGCMNHRRFDLAERVGRKLIELEPDHDGRYIGLSNVYAGVKLWDNARMMREAMERRGVKKSPGFSFVEVLGTLHRFIAHDKTHNDLEKIYMMLNTIVRQMMVDVDFETQERGFYDIEV